MRATFGAGCFWCTEAVFKSLKGVSRLESGYMGGHVDEPDYMQVCNGDTGHAEVIDLDYDPQLISFEELLLVFFKTHNPTTLNKQGNDVGTQYRSVIFYHNEEQRDTAAKMIRTLDEQRMFPSAIVTELSAATQFYKAEGYHQNYYFDNPSKPYCMFVIQPKLARFADEFKEKIKPELLA